MLESCGCRTLAAVALAIASALSLVGAEASAANENTAEVHWDVLSGGSYHRAGDYPSDFPSADSASGSFALLPNTNGTPTLGFVQLANTGSGTVEVHADGLSANQYTRIGDYASNFSPVEAANGVMQLFGSSGGAPELGFIKFRNTGTGTVEVHWETLQNGVYKDAGDYASDFPAGSASAGTWQLLGQSDGTPVLGFIQTVNTGSGMVEIHEDALTGSTYTRIADRATQFTPAQAANGVMQLFAASNGATEIGYIDLRGTGSGSVEMHWESYQNGAYTDAGDYASDLPESLAGDGTWQLFTPRGSAAPELGFVKTVPPPAVEPIVQSQPVPAPPRSPTQGERGRVRVTFVFGWTWNHTSTRLHYVRVIGLPRNARIEIRCTGRGCPHAPVTAGSKHLRRVLRSLYGWRFRAGDVLRITISAPHQRSERISLRIRDGALPRARVL
jgi:hypothetical protein